MTPQIRKLGEAHLLDGAAYIFTIDTAANGIPQITKPLYKIEPGNMVQFGEALYTVATHAPLDPAQVEEMRPTILKEFLRLVKMTSWRKFEITARSVTLFLEGDDIRLRPSRAWLSERGTDGIKEKDRLVALSPDALAKGVGAAFNDCELLP